MPPEPNYEIGYGKPPKHSQFKKGQPPNPGGRRRRSKGLDTFLGEILDEKVSINENGRRRTITKAEAMLKQLVNDAAKGNAKATTIVLRTMEMFHRNKKPRGAAETRPEPEPRHVVVLPHNNRDPLDPELLAAHLRVEEEHHAKKARERERQGPANENQEREVA